MPLPNLSQAALPDLADPSTLGLYVHWPFCQAKCPYCDFNSHVMANVDQKRWALALSHEIKRVGALTQDRTLTSIFFGGGTPSLMDPETVEAVLVAAHETWRWANSIEITLEANPTSIEANRFRGYRTAGVNRVSMGFQAMNDDDLKRLGRLHSAQEAMAALEVARSTFNRVSFDLIYARQDQTLPAWRDELTRALETGVDHLSLYQLTIEDGTAFGDRLAKGGLKGLPDEDRAADMWDLTQELTEARGMPGYEISNHARPDAESRHNLLYWQGGDYAGVGPGAHGRLTRDGMRVATECVKQPGLWLAAAEQAESATTQLTALSAKEVFEERLMMGLRLRDGVDLGSSALENTSLCNNIKLLVDFGLVALTGTQLRATDQGRPVLNSVLRQLLAD